MAQNGVIFHLLQTPVPLFIEESWPLGKCRPVFLALPLRLCLCLCRLSLSPCLFLPARRKPTSVHALFSKAECSSCLLSRCLTFILAPKHLPYCCFSFDLLSGVQFFCQKCTSGLWLRIRQGFRCRCGSCIVFKSTG